VLLYSRKTPAHTLPAVELKWTKVHVDMDAHVTSFHVIYVFAIFCVAHGLTRTRAQGCQIAHHHAAPAPPLSAAVQHGWDVLPVLVTYFCRRLRPCTSVQGEATMRHDILKRIFCCAVHCPGVAISLEPALHKMPGLEARARSGATGAYIAGLGEHPARPGVRNVCRGRIVTQPSGFANQTAAAMTDASAVARLDREKQRTYSRLEPNGYPFIPFSLENYGLLGKPAITPAFLGQLGQEAEDTGRNVSKSGFVAAAIRELSISLCRGNYQTYWVSVCAGDRPWNDLTANECSPWA
jgi:hypothetical protein